MSEKMYGVVNGVYFCNTDRNAELDRRLMERNRPSAPLQPQFSQRPVSTKYALLPIVDRRAKASVPLEKYPNFSVQKVFNPGNGQSPWQGFATSIDAESVLRNQYFALQDCPQSKWMPSTNSDMYQVHAVGRQEQQTFPLLFKEERFAPFNPNTCNLGKDMFNNFTQIQVKDSNCCDKKC
uniref:Uncharacterized protein n=1 Tax=viral metagenome TaxID=1070528 RepID=A0A6C0CNN3_9ZZZZ